MFSFLFRNKRRQIVRNKIGKGDTMVMLSEDGDYSYVYQSPSKQYLVIDEHLNVSPLDTYPIGEYYSSSSPIRIEGCHMVARLREIVAFMNVRQYGLNDAVAFYLDKSGKTWYVNKTSFDVEGFVCIISDLSEIIQVPERLISNLKGGGSIYQHPYSMQVVDWANLRRPSTTHATPLITFVDTTDPTESAFDMLVPVPAMPGLKDHISRKVIFDLTALTDESTPVFNLKQLGEAIKSMDHEVDDWTLDLNKAYVKFGKQPNPIKVIDLIKEVPNHRFFCSGTPRTKRYEKHVEVNTVPKTYP